MSTPITVNSQPFKTTDRELANALLTAGCKFAPQDTGGPAMNLYSADTLRQRYRSQRMPDGSKRQVAFLPPTPVSIETFEAATAEAFGRKIAGNVTYFIERDDVFDKAIKAWDATVEEFELAKRQSRAPKLPEISEETVMQVAYFLRRNKPDVESAAFVNSPSLTDGSSEKTLHKLEGVDPALVPSELLEQRSYGISGKGRIWTLSLDNNNRAALGLPAKQ